MGEQEAGSRVAAEGNGGEAVGGRPRGRCGHLRSRPALSPVRSHHAGRHGRWLWGARPGAAPEGSSPDDPPSSPPAPLFCRQRGRPPCLGAAVSTGASPICLVILSYLNVCSPTLSGAHTHPQ